MTLPADELRAFLSSVHPYDALDPETLDQLAPRFEVRDLAAAEVVYSLDERLEGLFLIHSGSVEVRDENGVPLSVLGPRNSFGERGLTRDGISASSARTIQDSRLLVLPSADFHDLIKAHPIAARFFNRNRANKSTTNDLSTSRVETLMSRVPMTCSPGTSVREAAQMMRDAHRSSICVTRDDRLVGIVTIRDISGKVVADGLALGTPVDAVMTRNPMTLPPLPLGLTCCT